MKDDMLWLNELMNWILNKISINKYSNFIIYD